MQKQAYSGFIGDLSTEQENALEKFREEVKAMGIPRETFDDGYLLRFLRARKFNLTKTKEMWTKFINWRDENQVDDINEFNFSEIDEMKKAWPHGFFRTDKLGRPIYIDRTGQLDLKHLLKITNLERMNKYGIMKNERLVNEILPGCSSAAGQRIDHIITILDLKGFSSRFMSKQVINFIKHTNKTAQDYYPELMGKMFIVNSPMLFTGLWSMMKPLIDEKTRSKIEVLGSKYQKKLLEIIEAENLPDFLGGKVMVAEYGENLTNEQGPWITTPSTISFARMSSPESFKSQEEIIDKAGQGSPQSGMEDSHEPNKPLLPKFSREAKYPQMPSSNYEIPTNYFKNNKF